MITCRLCGGLGNQLFQIFTVIAYGLKHSTPFFFFNEFQLNIGSTVRYTYWNTFLPELKKFLKDSNMHIAQRYQEPSFNYSELPTQLKFNSTVLVGYFQSPKYFEFSKTFIFNFLNISTKQKMVKRKCNELGIDFDQCEHVSMHFRFGDYKKYPDTHPILTETYYSNALSMLLKDNPSQLKVIYFCEDESILEAEQVIQKLMLKFPHIMFERANPHISSDWEQMLFMSLCSHNIIANSTFSWWGAYLNQRGTNKVYYPDKWFGPAVNGTTEDLFPERWIKVKTISSET